MRKTTKYQLMYLFVEIILLVVFMVNWINGLFVASISAYTGAAIFVFLIAVESKRNREEVK